MSESCPSCGSPPLGGQIVELSHATMPHISYAVICPQCSTVYQSDNAREQLGGNGDE